MHAICPRCDHTWDLFEPVTFGNIALLDIGVVQFQGHILELRRREFEICEALIRARGRRLTRDHLTYLLSGAIDSSTITKYVERTRYAFREIDHKFDQIAALKGFGAYYWVKRAA